MLLGSQMTSEESPERLARLGRGLCILALHELGDLDSANDVAQETLARITIAYHEGRLDDARFRDDAQLGAFARGIARHVIVDVIRSRMRTVATDSSTIAMVESPAADPLTALVSREQECAIHDALKTLSPADRALLRMTFFENATSEQVAERLHEPAARIRKRKERALERLRRAFLHPQSHTSVAAPTSFRSTLSLEPSRASGVG